MQQPQVDSSNAPIDALGQNQKLKDTCDRCAASKVRCTKEKPSCARCAKMGLACLYSPARRVGRPYRSTKDSSPEKLSGASNDQTQNVEENRVMHERVSPIHPFDSMASGPYLGLGANEPNTTYSEDPRQPFQVQPIGQIHHDTPDCMLDVLDLISDLDALEDQIRRSSSIDSSRVDSAKEIITTVFHRLSNVLLCPCSEKSEIFISITALCMTIIDIHAMMLNKFTQSRSELMAQDETLWGEHRGATEEYPDGDDLAIKVVGELSQIAKFAVQFNERYSGIRSNGQIFSNDGDIPLDFLPALGRFMQDRLQQISVDAMNWPYTST